MKKIEYKKVLFIRIGAIGDVIHTLNGPRAIKELYPNIEIHYASSMPEDFLGKIDEVADLESRSRSELIREALRSYITRNQVRKTGLADKNARILEALLD